MAEIIFCLCVILIAVIGSGASEHDMFNSALHMNFDIICQNLNATIDGQSISNDCFEQLHESCNSSIVLETMLDASSKFPYTGLAKSSARDYGQYDQCVAIDHNYNGGRILGKHCTFGFIIADVLHYPVTTGKYLLSVCMPNKCAAADYNILVHNITLEKYKGILTFANTYCATKETGAEISGLDCVTIIIFSICITLMGICTIHDIFLKRKGKKPAHSLNLAFSLLSNGKKLLQTSKQSKDQILVFHGIKTISMLWIIAGHGVSIWQFLTLSNQDEYNEMAKTMRPLYISSAVLGVDTFFYLAGFLTGWGYIKRKALPLMKHITSVPQAYIHRYLRLTPAVLILLLVQLSIFRHLGSGPLWHMLYDEIRGKCQRNWWALLLYIQNYHNKDDICMLHTWYLSADMQMFIISPIVLIPLVMVLKNPTRLMKTMIAMFVLNVLLTVLPIAIKLIDTDYNNDFDAHSKLHTYFIGVMMGVFLYETKDRSFFSKKWSEKQKQIGNLAMWAIMLLGMLAVVIAQRHVDLHGSRTSVLLFDALKRPVWAAGLSWIVYSSYYGYGGLITWFLSRPLMQIGGKLSYCIYLVHGLVVLYNTMVTRNRKYFSDYEWFYSWCGHFILATVVAIFWTLAFESPLITVERFLLGGGSKRSKDKKEIHNGKAVNDIKSEEITKPQLESGKEM